MKYLHITLLAFFTITSSFAQNTVKMSAVKSNDYGVAYSLPKTALEVKATVTKKTRKAGEFYQYAERYLNVSAPIVENETIYTLEDISVTTKGIPDKDNSYLVEFRTNTVSPFVTLTKDGLICAINEEVDLPKDNVQAIVPKGESARTVDPKSFLSEEILRAGSMSKQAELIAKQIYRLRESKTNILTGEADNMPPDGDAYKLVMSQIDEQEKALTSMFAGTEAVETIMQDFAIVPERKNIEKQIIFRFSKKLGIVESGNLAGAPVYMTLTSKEPLEEVVLNDKEQKAWRRNSRQV